MTQGGKDAIKKARDHNWDMERMQFQKQRGNILGENDYVNLETKAGSVGEAMGVIAAVNQQPILKDCYAIQ
jgi:hypothetical protein